VLTPLTQCLPNLKEPLIAKTVTFTQNTNEGSRTTLELCNPAALDKEIPSIK
jgi:hypothetical protein